MKNIGVKEQIFIAIGIVVLVIVMCFIFLWKPQLDKIGSSRTEIKNKENEFVQKKIELEGLKRLKTDAPKIEAQSLSLSKSMPEEVDIPSLIVEMEQVSIESNVKLLELKFKEPVVADGFTTVNFEGQIVGSYFNLADFFYQVTQMSRQVKVNNINFEIDAEGYPLINAKTGFSTYAYTTSPAGLVAGQSNSGSNPANSGGN